MSIMSLGLATALSVAFTAGAVGRPLVVLDPGHGGNESGTRSATGILEKHLVLDIAQLTAVELRKKGMRVVLTRTVDENVSYGRRVAIANRRGAAVFVSIHANWAPVTERQGIESYILSAEASDEATARLIEREEGGGGPEAPASHGDLSAILGDLAQTQAHAGSARLARRIQDNLGRVHGLRPSRGLRQAPFAVLKGARMPAVLVELGYLSNAAQARYLSSKEGQKQVAQNLARGIESFLLRRQHR